MYRTHWAVKDVDLFSVLVEEGLIDSDVIHGLQPGNQLFDAFREPAAPPVEMRPTVFRIPDTPVDQTLVSLMMPFGAAFNDVHIVIKAAVEGLKFKCQRADDIWEESEVIQDIVALIARSKVVICDFSDRNTNVFYEAGIAHTIGRPVIPITQRRADIPFDLQHHRFIEYHNNGEGLRALADQLRSRVATLMSR